MPTTIKLRNSVTTTSAPSSLVQGEVAINITDKKVWVGNAATTPIQLLGDGGSGSFTSIAFGAGTVSSPSITFTGDTNTGIYSPAADTIAFTEGGVESMRIDSAGNVGIGTSSPANRLHVVADNTAFRGQLSLQTVNAANFSQLTFYDRTTLGAQIYQGYNVSTAGLGDLVIGNLSNAGILLNTNNTERMRITSGGDVLVGTTTTGGILRVFGSSGRIIIGDSSVNYYDGDTQIFRNYASTERMRIDSSGNVGIGTSSPVAKLSVDHAIALTGAGAAKPASLAYGMYLLNGVGTVLYSAASTAFYAGDTERMRINSIGNLGLGTNSPTSIATNYTTLDIRGSAGGGMYMGIGGGTNTLFYTDSGGSNIFTNAAIPLQFGTNNAERMRILSTGQVLVGTTGQDGGNRLMSNNGANGWPVTSGTTQTNGCLRLRGGDNAVLDFGVNSVNTWIQATDLTSLNSIYWLFLNPNGGEVIVAGRTDNGAFNLQCNGTGVWGAGAYVNGSDERIKDNIAPLDSGLDVVTKLNPVTYKYKEDWSKDQSTQTGFIAQELLTALEGKNYIDGVVQQGGENQYLSVAYQNIIPILTKAIQEQQAMIEELKQEVAALKAK